MLSCYATVTIGLVITAIDYMPVARVKVGLAAS